MFTGPRLVEPQPFALFMGVDYEALDLPRAEVILDDASDLVRGELQQRIDRVADDVVELYGTGSPALLLPELPVEEVTAVTVDGVAADLTGLRVELGRGGRRAILRRRGSYWPRGEPVVVTYTHGYELEELPRSIGLVVKRSAARAYFNPLGIRQASAGRASHTFAGDGGTVAVELSDLDRKTLGPYYPGTGAGR